MEVFGLILLLFCACGGEAFTVRGPAVPLVVQVGASVILPCSVDTPLPLSELEVQWLKEDSATVVHLFQEGESRPESQNPSYRGRAEFFPEQVSKGNFSLLLVNVTTEDKGLYKCVVHTDQESHETMVEIDIERLVVTGAVEPVFAYAGEDVILNCSVDTHVPVGELEVEWVKINELVLVLLYDKGENIPESQDERFRGRAEFFSEEIPKGNFSMKLRDVRAEDKGEFMCKVHTDQESINATAWIQDLGFSSLHLLVLFCTISSAVVAVSVCIRALWFIMKKDQSNWSCLRCLHDSVPCILMAIAFTVWGAIERSFREGFVCGAINFFRILVMLKMAPYKKIMSDARCWRLANLALPLVYFVITTGVNSDVLHKFCEHHSQNTEGKGWLGALFGAFLVFGVLAVFAAGRLNRVERRTTYRRPVFYKAAWQGVQRGCLIISLFPEALYLFFIHGAGVVSMAHPVWICFCLFIGILSLATLPRQRSDYPGKFQVPLYLFGSAGLSVVNSVALASEVFLKAEKGERTVEDLQLITLPFESFFLVCFLVVHWRCVQETEHQRRTSSDIIGGDVCHLTSLHVLGVQYADGH